jgi:SAM-dependent methyltransferase
MRIGRLAGWYRWIEYAAFGRALERSRFANLTRLATSARVLILGEGDGRTLERLLILAPNARFDVFEISPEMIALAQKRTRNSDRVSFHCEDARTADWKPGSYDAIVTNFFLDCLNEQDARQLVNKLAGALTPEGTWLVSEFAIPKSGWRRIHAKIWIGTMYRFFRIATGLQTSELPPIDSLMQEAGMQCLDQKKTRAGLIVEQALSAALPTVKPGPSAARQTSPETSAPWEQPHTNNTAGSHYSQNNPGGNLPPDGTSQPVPQP